MTASKTSKLGTGAELDLPPSRTGLRWLLRTLFKKRSAQIGGVVAGILVFFAITGNLVLPHDPFDVKALERLTPPGSEHWFGTDEMGRDLFSRIAYGSRYTVMIGLISTGIASMGGFVVGMVAAYFGRWVDMLVMRLMDIMLGFPYILLSMAIVAMLGPSLANAMVAVGISGIPGYARLVRSLVLGAKEEEYVVAARAVGANDSRIMFRTILPNIVSPVIIYVTLGLPTALLSTAALSFLGLGTQPPLPEWGAMMTNARTFIQTAPWVVTAPGLAIFVVILGINMFGNALRDTLDPRLRDR